MFCPDYSPDESKIVFVTEREDFWEIFIMDADGNNCTKLTSNSQHYYPKFSPYGLYIFYCSHENDSQMYIYMMNIDGSNKIKLHAGQNFDTF
jgi:Tol biopolymer transport system component